MSRPEKRGESDVGYQTSTQDLVARILEGCACGHASRTRKYGGSIQCRYAPAAVRPGLRERSQVAGFNLHELKTTSFDRRLYVPRQIKACEYSTVNRRPPLLPTADRLIRRGGVFKED